MFGEKYAMPCMKLEAFQILRGLADGKSKSTLRRVLGTARDFSAGPGNFLSEQQ